MTRLRPDEDDRGRDPGHQDLGFTIVELLVALTVLSLLVVVLISVLDAGRRVFAATTQGARKYEEVATVRTLFRDMLSQVQSQSQGTVGEAGRSFAGTGQGLTVVSWGPRMLAANLPMEFSIGPGSDNVGLEASWRRNLMDDGGSEASRRVLATDRQFRFEYLAPSRGWTDVWNEDQPPTHVRMRIKERDNRESENRDGVISMIFEVRRLARPECSRGVSGRHCVAFP